MISEGLCIIFFCILNKTKAALVSMR